MRVALRKLAILLVAACGGGSGPSPTSNQPPLADLLAGDTVVAGQARVFDGSASSDPDGDSLRFSWSFGDGGRGGAAWAAPQTLQPDYSSSLMFHVRATATDRFVLFWHEAIYGVTFTRYRTLENGVLGSTEETNLWSSHRHTSFLVSPQNKVSIVGGRLSMNGLWAMRVR